jgi:3-hydroxybutyryl-CoA dehydrogenase
MAGGGLSMEIEKVGVIGCGIMGSGIAQVAALSGFEVTFVARSSEKVERGWGLIRGSLAKAVEKDKASAQEANAAQTRIRGTMYLKDLQSCDIIIETITEDLERKKELFAELDGIAPSNVIFTTNTSSFSVGEIAAATRRAERVAGLHFFNPAEAMKLVEIVRTASSSDQTVESLKAFALSLDKQPVIVKDTPGFIVNAFLTPYLNQVIQACDDGLASREDIDTAVRLGFGIRLGPLAMLDLIGLDVHLHIAETLFARCGDQRFAPPPLLRRMVEAGHLGRKTGKGFYEYR